MCYGGFVMTWSPLIHWCNVKAWAKGHPRSGCASNRKAPPRHAGPSSAGLEQPHLVLCEDTGWELNGWDLPFWHMWPICGKRIRHVWNSDDPTGEWLEFRIYMFLSFWPSTEQLQGAVARSYKAQTIFQVHCIVVETFMGTRHIKWKKDHENSDGMGQPSWTPGIDRNRHWLASGFRFHILHINTMEYDSPTRAHWGNH